MTLRIVIIGSGFGGIAAAIELHRAGFRDVTILEAADDLGGTWHLNTYPGAACDIPAHLYSFSYAQRRDWTRLCSGQAEILSYLRAVAVDHGVAEWVQTGAEVQACRFDETRGVWSVSAGDGRGWEAELVILATGQLNRPVIPAIEGLETFAGHSFHSARWDHRYDLRGQRVAVVGTGATAVQLVPPVAAAAGSVTVFQRSGSWLLPRTNRVYSPLNRAAIDRVPGLQRTRRALTYVAAEFLTRAIRHPRTIGRVAGGVSAAFMRHQLPDAQLRARVWPDYPFGCKRVLFSSAYLPALARDNVELVTERLVRATPAGLVTADGTERPFDCVIWATGFATTGFMAPMRVVGAGGVELADAWRDGAHAHLGLATAGFPSLFFMYGPNTNSSGGSVIVYLEAQAGYIRQAAEYLARSGSGSGSGSGGGSGDGGGGGSGGGDGGGSGGGDGGGSGSGRGGGLGVRPEVEAASDAALQARFDGTAWVGCDSWYRQDGDGRIVTNWPGYMGQYVAATRTFQPSEYAFSRPADRAD